jgi:putative thioredoxin
VEAQPEDLDARLALGRALAREGRSEDALQELLEVVRRDPQHADAAARLAMLDLFAILGGDHELVRRFRPALARALFR